MLPSRSGMGGGSVRGPRYAHTIPPRSCVGYATALILDLKLLSAGSFGMSTQRRRCRTSSRGRRSAGRLPRCGRRRARRRGAGSGWHQADLAVGVAEGDQLLAEQHHPHGVGVGLGQFGREHRGDPVLPHQAPHRRAGADAANELVFFELQHGRLLVSTPSPRPSIPWILCAPRLLLRVATLSPALQHSLTWRRPRMMPFPAGSRREKAIGRIVEADAHKYLLSVIAGLREFRQIGLVVHVGAPEDVFPRARTGRG